jgi:biopolymer transport protein ExbD
MTEISNAIQQHRRAGVRRQKKLSLKIDMTPMVDLGFLLISFFVTTTQLSTPHVMKLYMPHDGLATPTKMSTGITILTGSSDQLYYYYGEERDAGNQNAIIPVSWDEQSGIGKVLTEKQKQLDQAGIGRDKLVVIIKPGSKSKYKNLVDILDEMLIHMIERYAVVTITANEELFLATVN